MSFADEGKRVTVIAEAGTAHQGSLETAEKLIEAAANAGADAIKFQAVFAEEIVHPKVGVIDLPGGPVDIYEKFKTLERPASFYRELKKKSEEAGLSFLCSPFGPKSVEILLEIGIEWIKIASPELNHYPLLEKAAAKPLVLSTGVSTLSDIEESVSFLRIPTGPKPPLTLLHCITAYPAPEREYNLRLIPHLGGIFGVPTGVSDHSLDPLLVPVLATAVGAVAIEKHIGLSSEAGGLDDPISLGPDDFSGMVEAVRACEGKSLTEAMDFLERPPRYDRETMEIVLGSGIKRLAPSEAPFYGGSNRSLVALRDISPGERLSEKNVALLRSEQGHIPGLPPRFYGSVMGRKLGKPVRAAEGVTWSHLLL